MIRPKTRKQTVQITINIDIETFKKLHEKYHDVEHVLQLAAEQLAHSDSKNLAQLLQFLDQYMIASEFFNMLDDFIRTLRTIKSLEPSIVNDKEINEMLTIALAAKLQIIHRAWKLIRSLKIHHSYRKRVEYLLLFSLQGESNAYP